MPLSVLKSFIRQVLFWYAFFQINRLVFLIYHLPEISKLPFFSILASFLFGARLDLSTVGYIIALPFLLLLIQSLMNHRVIAYISKGYTLLMVLVFSIITAVEQGLYDEWKTKMNYKALTYLEHPSEVVKTASWGITILTLVLVGIQFMLGYYLYQKFVFQKTLESKRNYLFSALFGLVMPFIIFLGIRGDMGPVPINQSICYYSKTNILNDAAVNSGWNLIHSIVHNYKYLDNNPYKLMPPKEAEAIVDSIYAIPKDTTVSVLTTTRPNLVFILLEGWSADLVKALGGYDSLTPNFDKLTKDGLLFTNMFSCGDRSEQGMASILSGFPAQPNTSILKQINKFEHLPCIKNDLAKLNYHSLYIFGGQLEYGNIKAYLTFNSFDKIIDFNDFGSTIPKGGLGYHDEYVFKKFLEEQNRMPTPFFTSIFTLSTHAPYDYPMKNIFPWGGREKDYINSAFYADRCLGNYFEEARKQPWWANTLFVIVADHSHNSPRDWDFKTPPYKHIPFMLYGNVLKPEYKGKKVSRVSSQVDIPATILAQFGMEHKEYKWSKNLFNPIAPEFAYYPFPEGFAWVQRDTAMENRIDWIVYDYLGKRRTHWSQPESKNNDIYERKGKAYLQVLFQRYLDY